jgi:hypothetical protein
LLIASPFDDSTWAFLKNSDNATATQALTAILQVGFTILLLLVTAIAITSSTRTSRESIAKTEELTRRGWEFEQQARSSQDRNQIIAALPILHLSGPTVEYGVPKAFDTRIAFTITNVGNGLALFAQIGLNRAHPTLIEYSGTEDLFALVPGDTIERTITAKFLENDPDSPTRIQFREDGDIGTVVARYQDVWGNHLSTSATLSGSHDFSDLRFDAFQYAPEVLTRR